MHTKIHTWVFTALAQRRLNSWVLVTRNTRVAYTHVMLMRKLGAWNVVFVETTRNLENFS
jgi:hypothetical protein